jgi:integrase
VPDNLGISSAFAAMKERGGRELPPKVVQHLLGHSSIVMTLDVYGHLFRDGGDRAELAEASAALLA